jgi:hypothetical protein
MKNLTFILIIYLTAKVTSITINQSENLINDDAEGHFEEISNNLKNLRKCHIEQLKGINRSFNQSEVQLENLHRKSEKELSNSYRLDENSNAQPVEVIEEHFKEEEIFRHTHFEKEEELRSEHEEKIVKVAEDLHHDEVDKLVSSLEKLEGEYDVNFELKTHFEELKEELEDEIRVENEMIECYYKAFTVKKKEEINELELEAIENEENVLQKIDINEVNSSTSTTDECNQIDNSSNSNLISNSTQQDYNNSNDITNDDVIFQSNPSISNNDITDCNNPIHLENLLIDDITHDEECLTKELSQQETKMDEVQSQQEIDERTSHREFENIIGADFDIIDSNHKQEERHRETDNFLEEMQFEYDDKLKGFVSQEHYKLYERMKDINKVDSRLRNSLIDEVEYDLHKNEEGLHDALVNVEMKVEDVHSAEEMNDIEEHQGSDSDQNFIRQHRKDEKHLKESHLKEEKEMVDDHERIMQFYEDEHQRDIEVLEQLRA